MFKLRNDNRNMKILLCETLDHHYLILSTLASTNNLKVDSLLVTLS